MRIVRAVQDEYAALIYVAERTGEALSAVECDRLRQMVTEQEDALSAVRRGLELTAALDDADRAIIAAAWEGLKVLEGSEEEIPDA